MVILYWMHCFKCSFNTISIILLGMYISFFKFNLNILYKKKKFEDIFFYHFPEFVLVLFNQVLQFDKQFMRERCLIFYAIKKNVNCSMLSIRFYVKI